MAYKLFDHLEDITINKKPYDSENHDRVKSYAPYMVNRFFSMVQFFIPLVEMVNRFDIPKEVHYNYYFSTLGKRKYYMSYLGNVKNNKFETDSVIKCLCYYFECGHKEAERQMDILTVEQIQKIVNKCPKNISL